MGTLAYFKKSIYTNKLVPEGIIFKRDNKNVTSVWMSFEKNMKVKTGGQLLSGILV